MSLKKPLSWFLLASLALNLFLLGVVAAYQLHGRVVAEARAPRTQLRIEQIAETLPKGDAARLEAIFREHAAELGELTAGIGVGQDRQRDGFRAQPFDPRPVAAAMEMTRFNHDAAKRVVHGIILEAAEQMSPEGRAKLADWASPPIPDSAR
ncbi:MAG: periplasmic heavy metal sensor [Proteobacteria bacterium]|nr:periplasmic heavy metal sensor [Pseudomonadota bacterium]